MRPLIFTLCMLLLVSSFAVQAQELGIADPVQHYVAHSLKELEKKPTGWDTHADWQKAESSYLFRFSLDVVGGNEPEVFVGSSALNRWHVYQLISDHRYERVSEHQLWLGHESRFGYRKSGANGVIFYELMPYFATDRKAVIKSHQFHESEVISQEMDVTNQLVERGIRTRELAEVVRVLALGEMVEPAIEKVLLKKYIADPRSEWRPLNRAFNRLQQHRDPADAADLAVITAQIPWTTKAQKHWREWSFGAGLLTLLALGILSLVPWKLEHRRNRWTLLLPVLAAGIYGLNELLIPASGVWRLDRLLVYPLLAIILFMGVVRLYLFLRLSRQQAATGSNAVVLSSRTKQVVVVVTLLSVLAAGISYVRWQQQKKVDCVAAVLKPGMTAEEIESIVNACKFFQSHR